MTSTPVPEDPQAEVQELRARLAEAEETLRAIHQGEVDALLIVDASGERVYTLRSADAPYRALVEQMQDGAVTVTPGGEVIYSNRSFAELVNIPLPGVIGASVHEFVADDDRSTLDALIAAGKGKLHTNLASNYGHIDVHISVSTAIVDEVEHRTLVVTDLTALTKVQRESRSKDEFLAMLAHELRNPLGAIGAAAQVLNTADLRATGLVRAREIIHRQVRQLAHLLDDLLDVGRLVTGKIELARSRIDLADNVRSVATAIAAQHASAERFCLSTESVWISGDVVRLEQIVGNLLSNALKFSPPEGTIRVSVRAEGADAVLSVEDQGIGIESELLPHVFDLFVQGAVTPDRKRGGLGIGLTLVRRLVELHGGRVGVTSDGTGQGSIFTVRLPMTSGPADQPSQHAVWSSRRARRVLLVDDHADAREMYCMALQADGHDVFEAADGESALAMFRRLSPDVAIVDIGLPGMDGYQVARHLRQQPDGDRTLIVALTGYGFPEDRERSRLAGFDTHLVKPVAPDDLRAVLDGPAADGSASAIPTTK